MRGAFVAIEGGDGAGKGTLVAALSQRLRDQGVAVLTTHEPGGTPEGQALRGLLLSSGTASWEPWAELLLMTAARVQHAARVIRPAIAAGTVVVTDRFVGSTIAYQGAGRGLPIPAIEALHRESVGDLWPDLTVLLDLDPAIGIGRSRRRLQAEHSTEDRFERLDLAFHERVRSSFLEQSRHPARPHLVLDASGAPEHVTATATQAVLAWLAAT